MRCSVCPRLGRAFISASQSALDLLDVVSFDVERRCAVNAVAVATGSAELVCDGVPRHHGAMQRLPLCFVTAGSCQNTERVAQEVREVLLWLRDFGVSCAALKRRLDNPPSVETAAKLRARPSVAVAEANFAALRDELFMSDKQVRRATLCNGRDACGLPRLDCVRPLHPCRRLILTSPCWVCGACRFLCTSLCTLHNRFDILCR